MSRQIGVPLSSAQSKGLTAQRAQVKVILGDGCDAVTSAFAAWEDSDSRLEQRQLSRCTDSPPSESLVVVDGMTAVGGPLEVTRDVWTHGTGGEEVRLVVDPTEVARLTNLEFAVHWERFGGPSRAIHMGYLF